MNKLIPFFIIVLLAMSCGEATTSMPKNFDYGSIKENVYSNDFFDLEITFPANWVVQDQEQVAQMTQYGKEVLSGDDAVLKTVIKASEINSANLLTIFKYEFGAPVDYNPNLVVVAENIQNASGIKRGKDYLFHSKKLLEQSQLEYTFDKDIYTQGIGSKEFDMMETNLFYIGQDITQEYICTIVNGFSLVFIISYTTEEERRELQSIIEGIRI